MSDKKLLRAVGDIEDKYVDEAAPKRKGQAKEWIKWLSAAAGICLVIAVSVLLTRQRDSDEDGQATGVIEIIDEGKVPETGPGVAVEPGFEYYVYADNGKYNLIEEDVKAMENMDIEGVIKKWQQLNNVSNVTLNEVKREHTDAFDKEIVIDGNGYVEHTPAMDIYNIYLEGEALENSYVIGLINTIISYTEDLAGAQYVKPYLNGELIELGSQMHEYGYLYIQVDIEGTGATEGEDAADIEWAENGDYKVDISFIVKDEAGNPMKNIAYHLEFVSGEKGSYQPGYGITDSTGEFTRSVHPNATYILYLQKKNAVVYSSYEKWTTYESVVYEELTLRIDVDGSFTKEIIWDEDQVIKVAKPQNSVTIDVTQMYTGSYEDVFVQLISEYGSQIQLGYLNDDGSIVWSESQDGSYYLQLQWFDKANDGELTHTESYKIIIKDGAITVDDEWDGEMMILE